MNREQMKHLKERISLQKSRLLRSLHEGMLDQPKPETVVKAEAVITAWQQKREATRDARREKALNAVRDTEEIMHFGDPDKALAKVKWLEKFKV